MQTPPAAVWHVSHPCKQLVRILIPVGGCTCALTWPFQQGWETFTDVAMAALLARRQGLVFLLWGKVAQAKGAALDTAQHHVLTAAHPSFRSANKVGDCLQCLCQGAASGRHG